MAAKQVTIKVDADVRGALRAFYKASNELIALGNRLEQAGRSMSVSITLPLAAAGAGALKAYADIDTAMAGVAKTVEATDAQLLSLREHFKDLSEEIPVTATEFLEYAKIGGQLGVAVENLSEFAQIIAALQASTDLTGQSAALLVAQFAKITGTPQEQFKNIASTLVDLGNNLATLEPLIMSMAQRMAGAGRLVRMTGADILGIAGALSELGEFAQAGGTAMQTAFQNMASAVSSGGAELEKFAAAARMTATEFAALFREDPAMALVALVKGLQALNEEGGNVFKVLDQLGLGADRIQRGILKLITASDGLESSIRRARQAWSENVALTKEAERFYRRFAATLITLKNTIVNTAAAWGEAIAPEVKDATRGLKKLFNALESVAKAYAALPPFIRVTTEALVALLALMGPLLALMAAVVKFGGVLAGSGAAVVAMMDASAAFAVVVKGLGAALGALFSPLGLLSLTLVGVTAAFISQRREMALTEEASKTLFKGIDELRQAYEGLSEAQVKQTQRMLKLGLQERQRQMTDLLEQARKRVLGDKGLRMLYERGGVSIEQLVREGQLGEEFSATYSAVAAAIDRTAAALASVNALLREFEEDSERARREAAAFLATLGDSLPKLEWSRELWDKLNDSYRATAERVRDLKVEIHVLSGVIAGLEPGTDAFKRFREEIEKANQRLAEQERRLRSMQDLLIRTGAAGGELQRSVMPMRGPRTTQPLPPVAPPPVSGPLAAYAEAFKVAEMMRATQLPMEAFEKLVDPDAMETLKRTADELGVSFQDLTKALGLTNQITNSAAGTVIASFGAMAQAAIRGSQDMAQAVIVSFTQIMQAIAQRQNWLSGLGVPLVGAIGGIISALVARNQPQKVEVERYSSRALRQMEDMDQGPERVIIQIVSPTTGEIIQEVERELYRRTARDAVSRIPQRVSLGA